MLAVVNVFYYIGIFALYGSVNLITLLKDKEDKHTYLAVYRVAIILILLLSLVPTASLVK